MDALLGIVSGVTQRFRRDDDPVDRFHHRYTTILLAAFAFVSTTHQLVGEPIKCWAPKEFESSWEAYTNAYCWVKNTYFLPFEEDIPKDFEEHDEIIYYQWIPFIFLGMAIFFYLPSLVWTGFNSKAGVDSDNILETAEKFSQTQMLESKEKHLRLITNQIDRFVGSTPKSLGGYAVKKGSWWSRNLFCLCGKKFGNYLVILYTFTKILYIVNVLLQLFVLNSVLETEFNIFGIRMIQDAMEERGFLNHTIFPKVTMCDFQVRALGNVRRYTVQCLLPINLYTEKMFVFLWFWMVFILILTVASLISWVLHSALSSHRYRFIENALIITDRIDKSSKHDQNLCNRFVNDYLRLDGIFVLRLIGKNTNKITSAEIIATVWDNWYEKSMDNVSTDDDRDFTSASTMPLKPAPPPKPNYRPHGLPPPPPPEKVPYPDLSGAGNFPSSPVSPAPSAPNEYT